MGIKSKSGKIVSKAASARGKQMFAQSALKKWCVALQQARKALGIKGFCAVGGKTAEGKPCTPRSRPSLASEASPSHLNVQSWPPHPVWRFDHTRKKVQAR